VHDFRAYVAAKLYDAPQTHREGAPKLAKEASARRKTFDAHRPIRAEF
jgi:hypothetical protein